MKLKHFKTATKTKLHAPVDLRPFRHLIQVTVRAAAQPFVAVTVGILGRQFVCSFMGASTTIAVWTMFAPSRNCADANCSAEVGAFPAHLR